MTLHPIVCFKGMVVQARAPTDMNCPIQDFTTSIMGDASEEALPPWLTVGVVRVISGNANEKSNAAL